MEKQTIKKNQQSQKRVLPQSELDLALMTTDSVWGKAEVSPELREKLNQIYKAQHEDGTEEDYIQSLWGLLGYYTRDMRLANLSVMYGELNYCQYHLDLAGDFLQENMIKPFLICLSRVATLLELSQSKGGFLRRKMHTFTHEQLTGEMEPPKKNLFGVGKKKDSVR